MADSLHLGLPYIAAAQAQKHVTHNEALRSLDAIVMLSVLDRDLAAPPGSPAEGARYLVKATGTDAFAGKDGQIAHFRDGAWAFHLPRAGWIAYVADEGMLLVHDGSAWQPLLGAMPELQDVSRLGLGTHADATNPFSAVLNNALFAARTAADGGDGDLRCKLSKESASDTASLLLQDNFSGRAEIGLAGDDDLHLKVSSDGSTWRDGLVIAAATGKVSFPQGALGLREKLTAARTYYVRTDGSDANNGLANNAGGAFLTIQKALDVVFGTLDLGGKNITIQVGAGTYTGGISASSPQTGSGAITILGDAATPSNVFLNVTGTAIAASNYASLSVSGVRMAATQFGITATTFGSVNITGPVEFGACGTAHMRALTGGQISCAGVAYTISGSAPYHVRADGGLGFINLFSSTATLTGSPAFSSGFASADRLSIVSAGSFSSSGSTGSSSKRYSVSLNGVIYTGGGGVNFFPGDTAGTTSTGGQYA